MAKVLVGVTEGTAAYKAPGVIRRLEVTGHGVEAAATEAAFRFIPEETLSIAAGNPMHTDRPRQRCPVGCQGRPVCGLGETYNVREGPSRIPA